MTCNIKTVCVTSDFLTIHDDIVGGAELRVYQRGLFLTAPRPGAPGTSLRVGLDHQRLLTLSPLLLLQQGPLWNKQENINLILYINVVSF